MVLHPAQIIIWSVGYCGRRSTHRTQRKTLGERREPSSNSTHTWHLAGIEPGPPWWEVTALTTAPSLLPYRVNIIHPKRISLSMRAQRLDKYSRI